MSLSGQIIGGTKGIVGIVFTVFKWILIIGIIIASFFMILWALRNFMDALAEIKRKLEHKKLMEEIENGKRTDK